MTTTASETTDAQANNGWQPYDPVDGSFVALLADGSFQVEGTETVFAPADAVSESNATLSAQKEAGEGKPLSVTLLEGSVPVTITLRFDVTEKRWYRRDDAPSPEPAAALNTTHEGSNSAVKRTRFRLGHLLANSNGELFFKVAFFVFLGWYLFVYQGTFRGESLNDEVLPDYITADAPASKESPPPGTSPEKGNGKGETILYDGGYNNKPPGW